MPTTDWTGFASEPDFRLVYQPIVHLDTGEIAGVEALCRFADGRSPEHWFQECAHLDLAAGLDLAIIERALADLPHLPDGYLSINLSPSTLRDPRLAHQLRAPGVPTDRIIVEVTEHARVNDYLEAQRVLGALRKGGIRLAVDDAGSGYASLRHILELRPDIIKMDQSITRDIDADPARRALATALVIFAGEVGASLVAEGVETDDELRALMDAGIYRGQGFAISAAQTLPLAPLAFTPPARDEVLSLAAEPTRPAFMDFDATVAVTAHGLLSAMGAIEMVLNLVRQRYGVIPEEEFRALVGSAERQARLVNGVLRDLVRGMPTGTLALLDELSGSHTSDEVRNAI
ncbi:MAG: EAL domain-containing protein [Acidimicrobiia bacterium]|nr:EAL domain-containing protein [Acidimicrobiia bacterium]